MPRSNNWDQHWVVSTDDSEEEEEEEKMEKQAKERQGCWKKSKQKAAVKAAVFWSECAQLGNRLNYGEIHLSYFRMLPTSLPHILRGGRGMKNILGDN